MRVARTTCVPTMSGRDNICPYQLDVGPPLDLDLGLIVCYNCVPLRGPWGWDGVQVGPYRDPCEPWECNK